MYLMYLQTIIEALKHACTGELPPNARSGQSFVHDPKVGNTITNSIELCTVNLCASKSKNKSCINFGTTFLFWWWQVAGETEIKGQIKLRFKTAAGKDVVCIRSFQLTQKGTKMEYKAIESVLQTIDPQTGEVLITAHSIHWYIQRVCYFLYS